MTDLELDRIVDAIAAAFGVANPSPEQRKAVKEELGDQGLTVKV